MDLCSDFSLKCGHLKPSCCYVFVFVCMHVFWFMLLHSDIFVVAGNDV